MINWKGTATAVGVTLQTLFLVANYFHVLGSGYLYSLFLSLSHSDVFMRTSLHTPLKSTTWQWLLN